MRKGGNKADHQRRASPRGGFGRAFSADRPSRQSAPPSSHGAGGASRPRGFVPQERRSRRGTEPNRRRHSAWPPAVAATPEPDEPAPALSPQDKGRSGKGSQRLSFRALAAIAAASAFFTLSVVAGFHYMS